MDVSIQTSKVLTQWKKLKENRREKGMKKEEKAGDLKQMPGPRSIRAETLINRFHFCGGMCGVPIP